MTDRKSALSFIQAARLQESVLPKQTTAGPPVTQANIPGAHWGGANA